MKLYDYKCFYLLNDDFGGKFQNPFSPKLFTKIFGDFIKNHRTFVHRKYFHYAKMSKNLSTERIYGPCSTYNFTPGVKSSLSSGKVFYVFTQNFVLGEFALPLAIEWRFGLGKIFEDIFTCIYLTEINSGNEFLSHHPVSYCLHLQRR